VHDNKPDQFVDELLDASLKRYGAGDPRAGLEMRLLAGVRGRQGAARRRRLVWALAVCAGMLAAVVFLLHSARVPSRQHVTSASVPRPTVEPLTSLGSADSRFGSPRLAQGPKEKPRPKTGGPRYPAAGAVSYSDAAYGAGETPVGLFRQNDQTRFPGGNQQSRRGGRDLEYQGGPFGDRAA